MPNTIPESKMPFTKGATGMAFEVKFEIGRLLPILEDYGDPQGS